MDLAHSQHKRPKSLVMMKSSGISHKEKGGRLPLLLQAEVKAPPESLHERTI